MTALKYRNPANPTEWLYVPTGGPPGADGADSTVPGPPGAQGAPVVELTQAAYDALGTKDPDTLYVITDGADRTVLSGTVPPATGTGIAGDYYINYSTWTIYGPKTTVWPAGVSIIGADGTVAVVEITQAAYDALGTPDPDTLYVITDGADRTVLSGTVPPSSIQGIAGDYYIDHVAWMIYGPKTTVWPTGVSMTAGGGGITTEDAVDGVAAAFAAGTHTNVTVTYNDAANSISLAASGGGGGITAEDAVDAIAAALTAGQNIDLTYNDTANTLTVAVENLTSTDVGLANVDNTSDAAKPISTATQTALDAKITGANGATTLWKGTQAQYDAIGTKDSNTVYVVTA